MRPSATMWQTGTTCGIPPGPAVATRATRSHSIRFAIDFLSRMALLSSAEMARPPETPWRCSGREMVGPPTPPMLHGGAAAPARKALWYPSRMAWSSSRNACALVAVAILLAVGAAAILAIAGPGHRWGWWGFRAGIGALKWTVFVALLAAVLGLVALVIGLAGAGRGVAIGGLVAVAIAVAALWVPI